MKNHVKSPRVARARRVLLGNADGNGVGNREAGLNGRPGPARRSGSAAAPPRTGSAWSPVLAVAVALVVAGMPAATVLDAQGFGGRWQPQGPAPLEFAQIENVVPNNQAEGAIHTVAAHPTDPDVVYVGTVNGGIWRTTNATALEPSWQQLTDAQASLSIGALEFDPSDSRARTLVAGVGLWSSFGRLGGPRTGLLRTTNAGNSWTPIDGGGILLGKNVSGVAARGSTLVVSVDLADAFTFGNIGIFRSTNGGASFQRISGAPGSGLPPGVAYDLVGDPNDANRLYTNVNFADLVGGQNGIYRSDDAGATWTRVSDPAIDALIISGGTSNIEIAVGQSDNVFVAVANSGRLAGVFRSPDGGATWQAMDIPGTIEDGVFIGIHPGGQASLHMSIVADPTDPNIVYVGGDRQPFAAEGSGNPALPQFPNSIGAFNFSGRLFRGDAAQPSGSQWAHLTHRSDLGPAGGGTASSSSPHADSREMVFDATGNLLQTDDGGIYRRTDPRSASGDWFSLAGDLQVIEMHSSSYDAFSDILFGGTQDNGSEVQDVPGAQNWFLLLSGDGGDTAVDDFSNPAFSTRYNSAQLLQAFVRSFWNTGNGLLGFTFPARTLVGGGAPPVYQFVTPVEMNAVDPFRLIIGAVNGVYETFDRGDTIQAVGPGILVNGSGRDAVSYGSPGNPDVVYVGSNDTIFVRTGASGTPFVQSTTFPGNGTGSTVRDIVIDPSDWRRAVVCNTAGRVFSTPDAGATWTELTGDLGNSAAGICYAITYVERLDDDDPGETNDAIIVGMNNGAFVARENQGFTSWKAMGTGLPTAPVFDLDYDAGTDVLIASTLGRGSFRLEGIAAAD